MDRNKLDRANEINRKLGEMKRKAEWLCNGCSVHFKEDKEPTVRYDDDESYLREYGDVIESKEILELAKKLHAKLKEKLDSDIKKLQKDFDEL